MSPKIRKRKTKGSSQEYQDKIEAIERQARLIADHPKECCMCDRPFERTAETVINWHVVVNEERVRLTCPPCWAIVRHTLEKE
jgi:hypothetical protein|tara:strand:+ start:339 stop:587 length:249 start_codon:yes stop_codon:yes gene_type:complete